MGFGCFVASVVGVSHFAILLSGFPLDRIGHHRSRRYFVRSAKFWELFGHPNVHSWMGHDFSNRHFSVCFTGCANRQQDPGQIAAYQCESVCTLFAADERESSTATNHNSWNKSHSVCDTFAHPRARIELDRWLQRRKASRNGLAFKAHFIESPAAVTSRCRRMAVVGL